MSDAGVAGARALVDDTLKLIEQFGPTEWQADTACHGWRVHDLLAHMGFFFNLIADPNLALPPNPSGKVERLNDAAVRERADLPHEAILDYYREQSTAGLVALAAVQSEELREVPMDMQDIGVYQMHQLSDAVSFDHLTHLTSDLFVPFGPIEAVEVDIAAAIDPAINWMISGLPKMCGKSLHSALTSPLSLRLTGETQRTFSLHRVDDSVLITETEDLHENIATSQAIDFLRWGTTRTAWRSAVTVSGDSSAVAPILDAFDIV